MIVALIFAMFSEQVMAQNIQCVGDWEPKCTCMQKFVPNKGCVAGGNKKDCPCQESANDYTASGKCVAVGICKASATSDGKLDPGLAKLGEMLGKLMEMMKKQEKGEGGSPTNPQTGGCTTMQPTGDKSLAEREPMCYYYDSRLETGNTDPNAIDPSGGLVATPTNGATPLKVDFAFTNGTTGCKTPTLLIDFGDGTSEQQPTHFGTTCTSMSDTAVHTYEAAGNFAARLKNAATGEVRGGVNIIVEAGTASTTNPLPNTTDTGTGTGGTNDTGDTTNTGATGFTGGTFSNITNALFNTPLTNLGNSGSVTGGTNSTGGSSTGGSASTGGSNSTGEGATLNFNSPQSIVQSIIQKNLPTGTYGDVKILQNGTTIIAGVREKNSEVAGFYGTNTTVTGGGVAGLCANRPWARNFLSFIIPATFFDSLCTLRGYTVGRAPATATLPTTKKTGTTTTKTNTVKTTVGGTKATVTATSAPVTAPNTARVDIWASPLTVPLGARTSIFWNTQGVTDCIETSPDGSFSHASLKGGASTVPLTAATVFTISCIAPNGAPITDSVTVLIAL